MTTLHVLAGAEVGLRWWWRRLTRRTPRRTRPVEHVGATIDTDFAAIADLPLSDELVSDLEFERDLNATMRRVEADLHAGLERVYAQFLAGLGLSAADLLRVREEVAV